MDATALPTQGQLDDAILDAVVGGVVGLEAEAMALLASLSEPAQATVPLIQRP